MQSAWLEISRPLDMRRNTFMVCLRSKCHVAQRKRGNLGAVSGKGNLVPQKGKRAVEFQGIGGKEKKRGRSGALVTVLLNPE